MDVLAAYREVGSYRGAAEICGTTHKTVKRIVERTAARRRRAGAEGSRPQLSTRCARLVAERVDKTSGPDLGEAAAAGGAGGRL